MNLYSSYIYIHTYAYVLIWMFMHGYICMYINTCIPFFLTSNKSFFIWSSATLNLSIKFKFVLLNSLLFFNTPIYNGNNNYQISRITKIYRFLYTYIHIHEYHLLLWIHQWNSNLNWFYLTHYYPLICLYIKEEN
jgi:hypothetical protein